MRKQPSTRHAYAGWMSAAISAKRELDYYDTQPFPEVELYYVEAQHCYDRAISNLIGFASRP